MRLLSLLLIIGLLACSSNEEVSIEDSPAHHNSYSISYARGFSISQSAEGKRVNIYDLNNSDKLIQTLLLVENSESDDPSIIHLPIESVACNSTTHVSYFPKLGIEDRLIGTTWPELIMNPVIQSKIERGEIKEIGANGEINLEVALEMSPEVLMVYPFEDLNYDQYKNAGLKLIFNTEYQEQHPLAKAEWLKFYGVLFGVEEKAEEVFSRIEKEYLEYSEKVENKGDKPIVFSGSFLYGEWFAPGSASSTAQSIRDAGARYIFEGSGEKNVQMDFELMLTKVQDADYYGKLVSEAIDMEGIISQESRLGDIPAIRNNKIFYCNTSEADYFGDAIVEPEVILADLISIFHPGTLPEHENKYFQLVSE